jgi:VCBS repeat protein
MLPLIRVLLLLFLLTVLSFAALAQGAGLFAVPPTYTGSGPVVAADFNQDGKLDLITGANGQVLFGNGDGTFKTGPKAGFTVGRLLTADFNGDGKPDLVYLTQAQGTIAVRLGNGDGTFQPEIDTFVGGTSSSIFVFLVADLNGDGKPDVLLDDGSVGLFVLLGDGSGHFTVLAPNLSIVVESAVIGDFNGDGKLDLAFGTLGVALGNGDGTFQAPKFSSGSGFPVAVGDFNGDGKLDVVMATGLSTPGAAVTVQLGKGDGTFQPPVTPSSTLQLNGALFAVADFNGDGKLDLIVSDAGDSLRVLLGNGDGTFILGGQFAIFDGDGGASVVVADFNRDGKLDVVISGNGGSFSADWVTVLLGNGDGSFKCPVAIPPGGYPVAADFNGDGKPDLATLGSSRIDILINNGPTPTAVTHSYSFPAGVFPQSFMAAADVNGDGKTDLLLVAEDVSGTGTVWDLEVFPGNGDGTFGTPIVTPLGSIRVDVFAVGDFNGDHKPDVAMIDISGINPNNVYVLLGNGDGTFGAPTSYFAGNQLNALALADFNGDGKLDIAVASNSGLAVLLGEGNGIFQNATFISSTSLFALTAGDVNGDGKADLVTAQNGVIQVFLGNGDGTFRPMSPFGVGGLGFVMVLADMNRDGKLDIVEGVGGIFDDLFVYPGDGDGTFGSAIVSRRAGGTAVVADFNQDGKLDVAVDTTVGLVLLVSTAGSPQSAFTMSAMQPSPSSVPPGGSASSTIAIAAANGFNASVTLSCSSITLNGSPATKAPPLCSFNPPTLANASGTSQLTITTTGNAGLLFPVKHPFRVDYAIWLQTSGWALLGVGFLSSVSRRKKILCLVGVSVVLVGLIFLEACGGGRGGGSSGSGTPAGTYTITVQASGAAISQSTPITLTVQ